VNPIYFFPSEEEIIPITPSSDFSPFIDASAGFSQYPEGVNYSDSEEYYAVQIPEQLVLADFVPTFGPT